MAGRTFESFIEPHPAWTGVSRFQDEVEKFDSDATDEDVEIESYDEDLSDRMRAVAAQSLQRLGNANPELVSAERLSNIQTHAANCVTGISELRTSSNVAGAADPVAGMHGRLDGLTDEVLQLPAAERDGAEAGAAEARAQLDHLQNQYGESRREIERLGAEVLAKIQELEEGEVAALDASAVALRTDLTSLSAEINAALADQRAEYDELQASIADEAKESLLDLHERQEKAREIVAAIGGEAVTGGFIEWEKRERKSGEILRFLGVVVAIAAIAALVWFDPDAVFQTTNSWQRLAARLTVGAVVLGLAGYLSREATQHFENANYARRIAIELTSVGSFAEEHLTDDDRKTVMRDFSRSVFGKATPPAQRRPNRIRPRRGASALDD